MMSELDKLRTRFGQLLVILFWSHVPMVAFVASVAGRPFVSPALATISSSRSKVASMADNASGKLCSGAALAAPVLDEAACNLPCCN